MASNVTVILEDARRIMVKTSPTMSLLAVLKEACERAKIPDPTGYGLKCVCIAYISVDLFARKAHAFETDMGKLCSTFHSVYDLRTWHLEQNWILSAFQLLPVQKRRKST